MLLLVINKDRLLRMLLGPPPVGAGGHKVVCGMGCCGCRGTACLLTCRHGGCVPRSTRPGPVLTGPRPGGMKPAQLAGSTVDCGGKVQGFGVIWRVLGGGS